MANSTTSDAPASVTVIVTQMPTSLTLSTPSVVLTYKPTFQVTAHLGPTYNNRKVSIYAIPAGTDAPVILLKSGTNATQPKLILVLGCVAAWRSGWWPA